MNKYRFSDQEQSVLEGLQQPFAVYQFVDNRVVTLSISEGFCDLFGYEDRAEAYHDMDHDMYKDTHPDDTARIANAAIKFATEGGNYEVIYRSKIKNSADYRIIHASGKHVYTESGVRLAHVWYLDEGRYTEDSTPTGTTLTRTFINALHEDSLLKTSQHDHLTGLPTMSYFFKLADSWNRDLKSSSDYAVLLFLNLIGMKFFNSKYGFTEGDHLLQAFARILSRIFNSENCCHVGGDHFAVYTKEEGLEKVLEQLFRECKELNSGDSLPIRVGIYSSRMEDVPVSVAVDRAKIACDAIKSNFESGFHYYDKNLSDDIVHRQYILSNLDRALEERWIQVEYQPIVRTVNGRVCDEEALARWIDPERGRLSPAEFIPFLEDSRLIYKLDLYVVDRVLEKIKSQEASGLIIVPHSINLSRSDFSECDIVEEICRRVDAAGVSRDKITIEITESVIGKDFDFMKKQVERFQSLGFPVWMDDFGSGYSSLDVLQSIHFNLIKFDMSFMKRLNEGDDGKIILTELVKMATSLGLDTVCEGVETEDQVRFLQEIGCSKLQGFYYCKAISLEQIQERYQHGIQIGYENPAESEYYEIVSRINLYDYSVIASENVRDFHHFFNTLPMGIIEVRGDKTRFARTNQSYRDFIKRFFSFDLSYEGSVFTKYSDSFMNNVVKTCCEQGVRAFYDEKMTDGSIVHSFARRIGINPVNGTIALAVIVLSITPEDEGTSYAELARALAADYYNLYYVDLETERYTEYSSSVGEEELALERHGEKFFEAARRATMTRIYEEDREHFLSVFTKEHVLQELDKQGVFTLTYRLIDTGLPMYVNMKVMRMNQNSKRIIIGISIIDSQMKQQEMSDRIHREEMAYSRVMALSDDYLSLYTVDPATDHYFEYIATTEYDSLGLAKVGEDFFRQCIIDGEEVIYPEDQALYRSRLTKENILKDIKEKGVFQLRYRLIIGGVPKPVLLKIVAAQERDGQKLIAGVRVWRERKNE